MGYLTHKGYHTFKDGQEVIEPWCPADPIPDDAVVFSYRKGFSAGNIKMKERLGGKGAGLCEMGRIGVNVPPGFTITTDVCQEFYKDGRNRVPEYIWEYMAGAVADMEDDLKDQGLKFASDDNPLLVSVRSGAALSMPGMMNTVLNLGLNDRAVLGLAKHTNERFAWDCYRRFLDMYGDVVLNIPHDDFEEELQALKDKRGVKQDVDLTADDLKELVTAYKGVYSKKGLRFPEDPWEQLQRAVAAVFESWMVPRAVKYRQINKISGLKGTAVNVVAMVYGNLNDESCTGVCFTRDPATGERRLYGEYLVNAQGEDVVAGIRTPKDVDLMKDEFPEAYADLCRNTQLLERHMKDMQDCEFTVMNGRLFMLQTRNGKRTGAAALKVAQDMVREGLIKPEEAICMVEARHLDQLLHPQFKDAKGKAYTQGVFAKGLAASPGAAVGQAVFTADDAEAAAKEGRRVILVRVETVADDVGGMHSAEGILTSRGGMTSHAAVVARGWGKPCVCGAESVEINVKQKFARANGVTIKEGDWLSINGTTGEIVQGQHELVPPQLDKTVGDFMKWVNEHKDLNVYTNSDTPEDTRVAYDSGARGIGLCRTEHMFFATPQRITDMRKMIVAMAMYPEGRQATLEALKKYQVEDFIGLFEAMDGHDVTVRLLDPPLHEFLPKEGEELEEVVDFLSKEMKLDRNQIRDKLEGLHEVNPMMGLRGCRLGIVHPEITEMQAEAFIEAACLLKKRGKDPRPYVMVPLVGKVTELEHQLKVCKVAAQRVMASMGVQVDVKWGTMIEIPRACIIADQLAEMVDFFSFGTNDLTQMTLGYSRDDAQAKFFEAYFSQGILQRDPFETLDRNGVGILVKMACDKARSVNPNIKLGICGEHGGDPESVAFFHQVGVNYVSCSPLRVPIALLAAAQAKIKGESKQSE